MIFKLNFVSCPDVDLLEAPREHIFLVGARAVQGYAAGCVEICGNKSLFWPGGSDARPPGRDLWFSGSLLGGEGGGTLLIPAKS